MKVNKTHTCTFLYMKLKKTHYCTRMYSTVRDTLECTMYTEMNSNKHIFVEKIIRIKSKKGHKKKECFTLRSAKPH